MQAAREEAVGALLGPVANGVSALYLAYALGHELLLPSRLAHPMALLALASAVAVLAIGKASSSFPSLRCRSHALAGAVALVSLANCGIQLFTFVAPVQTISLILLVVAMGSFFLSWRWLGGMIALCWACWILAALRLGDDHAAWVHYGFGFFTATVLSLLIQFSRMRSLDKLMAAHQALNANLERATRSEERFRRLTDATSEGILIHDGGTITDANPALCNMFGRAGREMEGRRVSDFILFPRPGPGNDAPGEVLGFRADGQTFPIEVRSRRLLDHELTLEILALADLTERKSTGQIIADQQRMLFEADKLSALGEMAAGIVHEIRNPLTSILLQAEFIRKRGEAVLRNPELVLKAFDRIGNDASRINRIIHGIRLISRDAPDGSESSLLEECSIWPLVLDAVELCRERATRQGIRFTTDFAGEEPVVPGNPTQILQVLINLISNACDAVEALPERWVHVSCSAAREHAEIWVTDSGSGVPDSVREKIMQPFFTTKPLGKGTGLGLSISKKIVEAHRGALRLDEQSEHTRFVIRLPLRSASPPSRAEGDQAARRR